MDRFKLQHVTPSTTTSKREAKDKRINFPLFFFEDVASVRKSSVFDCDIFPAKRREASIDVHRNKYGVITSMRFAIFMKILSSSLLLSTLLISALMT